MSTKWYKLKQMKARLKSTQEEEFTRLSDMKKGQFAVVTSEEGKGSILYRPNSYVYAVDLTANFPSWPTSLDAAYGFNPEVRILRAGELVEIVG